MIVNRGEKPGCFLVAISVIPRGAGTDNMRASCRYYTDNEPRSGLIPQGRGHFPHTSSCSKTVPPRASVIRVSCCDMAVSFGCFEKGYSREVRVVGENSQGPVDGNKRALVWGDCGRIIAGVKGGEDEGPGRGENAVDVEK